MIITFNSPLHLCFFSCMALDCATSTKKCRFEPLGRSAGWGPVWSERSRSIQDWCCCLCALSSFCSLGPLGWTALHMDLGCPLQTHANKKVLLSSRIPSVCYLCGFVWKLTQVAQRSLGDVFGSNHCHCKFERKLLLHLQWKNHLVQWNCLTEENLGMKNCVARRFPADSVVEKREHLRFAKLTVTFRVNIKPRIYRANLLG